MTWEVFQRPRRRAEANVEFERFEALARRLLEVPKGDVVDSPDARLSWARPESNPRTVPADVQKRDTA